MKIYIASVEQKTLKMAKDYGVHGIITNPTVIAEVKRPWRQTVAEAARIIEEGPFHLQITEDQNRTDAVKQVREFYEIVGDRLVVKACISQEMLSLIPVVKKMNLKMNISGIVTLGQALVAAQAGADYISVYLGRAENAGIDSIGLVEKAAEFINREELDCKIVAASIKSTAHFIHATNAGANFAACPYPILKQLIIHETTEKSIINFREDWTSIPEK